MLPPPSLPPPELDPATLSHVGQGDTAIQNLAPPTPPVLAELVLPLLEAQEAFSPLKGTFTIAFILKCFVEN